MSELIKEGFEASGVNYALIWGRFTPILYRPEKLELVDTEFFTYPEKIDGLIGEYNDVRSKALNIAVFRVKENGNVFVFATTHLWWKADPKAAVGIPESEILEGSDAAREYQVKLAIEKIEKYRKKYNCPAVFVGDMNTGYDSDAIRYARSCGYRHAHDIATDFREESVGYHNCYRWGYETFYFDTPFEKAIDHILVLGEKEGAVKRFERYSPDYYFPISDHSAAYIDIEI